MMFDSIVNGIMSLGYIYLILAILPLFVQVTFQILINMVSNMLKLDLKPLVNLLLLPGSLVRLTFVWLVFAYYGYEFQLRLIFPYFGRPASNLSNDYNYRGIMGAPKPQYHRPSMNNIKTSLIITMVSYSVMGIVALWVVFRDEIVYSLQFLLPYSMVSPTYFYILISLLIGGMPVPEESMTSIYVFIMQHPQLVVMVLLDSIGALILTPYLGVSLTFFYWLIMMLLGFYIWNVYESYEYEKKEISEGNIMDIVAEIQ